MPTRREFLTTAGAVALAGTSGWLPSRALLAGELGPAEL
ncbi:MAG: twin-arginine translocation signal domain-containing protein, partial [Burkholderiales bacterium]